jgi:hypothetical protein
MSALPRPLMIAALVGVIVACLGALWSGGVATREAATRGLADRSLAELALLAGLADDQGQLLRDEPMAVEVIADGGPMWALEAVSDATARSPWFELGNSPHLLRTEVIDERGGIALQLHLWRGGWELREPQPRRVRVAAWAAVIAGVLGAGFAAMLGGRLSLGLGLAGLFAQLLLALDPLPAELFPPQSLLVAWSEGPLFGPLFDWIRAMTPLHVAIAAALVALCLVLVGFDHKRSRERDLGLGWAGAAAVLGSFGALGWVEAASRGSLLAACDLRVGAWTGWLALLGLIVAWLPAIHLAREAWRAQHARAGA